MPISDWEDLCVQTIIWQPLASRDSYGKPTYGAAQRFKGRRVFVVSRVPGGGAHQGADVMTSSTIWVLGLPNLKYEDRLYVLGDTKYPPIANIQRFPDEEGDLYVKAMMGGASS